MRDNFCDFLCSVILAFPGYFLLKFFPFACLHTVPLPWEKGSALKGNSLLPKWAGVGGGMGEGGESRLFPFRADPLSEGAKSILTDFLS